VLVVSSADVYGKVTADDLPIDEDQPLRPISPYGASKVAAEYLALQAWTGYGLGTIRVRSFNHIGPGQEPRFVASALAHRVAEAERTGVDHIAVGNVTPRRDFTDVRDVVRAYRLAVLHGAPGEVYNVASGRDVAIEDLARSLIARAETPLRLDIDPALQRPVDNPVSVGDATKLRTATGWAPDIPLDETLAALLDDARQTDLSRPTTGQPDSTRT
jgi:GDP-4-dehydro-6-deoxy-D-mannose reductase